MSWDHNNNNTTTIAITEAAAAAAVAAAATTRGVHSFQWGFTVPIHCYCGRDLCVDCVDNTYTCNKLYRMMTTITQFNSRGRQKIVNRPFTYKETITGITNQCKTSMPNLFRSFEYEQAAKISTLKDLIYNI